MRMRWMVPLTVVLCATAGADSLFAMTQGQKVGTLVSEKKARFKVGDIITVLVRENIEASTQADTNTRKETEVENEAAAGDNTFLTNPKPAGLGLLEQERLPNWKIEANNEHRSRGLTSRQNSLVTSVSCFVVAVNPNDTIEIRGERMVAVNREDSRLFVNGIARARDVSPDNTIDSARLANAMIELRGRGPLWNNQRRGLVTRLLDWFSPF